MIFFGNFQKCTFHKLFCAHSTRQAFRQDRARKAVRFSSNVNYPAIKNPEGINENYGQPTSWTHPHLINDGEVVQGIPLEEIKDRRRKLMQTIRNFSLQSNSKLKSHVIVIPSSTKKYMSDKIPYVFRQNSDFLYLSGCLEPDSVLALIIDDQEVMRSILFMRPKDKHAELWDGARTGVENSIEFFGVDEAYSMEKIGEILKSNIVKGQGPTKVWYDVKSSDLPKVTAELEACCSPNYINLESPTIYIHRLRAIKSSNEVELMRKTCRIASKSINETMKETRPGDSEHHIFARVDYKCRMRNASYLAYPPVVATGKNATTIHYINNTQLIKNGDLVLMDAGCEYAGYTSDITRTWPVNGSFSSAQKVLYDLLLVLQKDLLNALLMPGGKTLDDLFDTMCLKMGNYLQEINLIPKGLSDHEVARAAYSFCPHHVSHYLGMDVHDTPLISRSTKLVPGMVCTVEPGIYISSERRDVPPEFRGLGLRIEDDIYITSSSSIENLTESCVKERETLEVLLKR